MWKIVVDRGHCDGNGNCTEAAPALLSLDEDDRLQILKETFGREHRKAMEASAGICPKHALSLKEEERGP